MGLGGERKRAVLDWVHAEGAEEQKSLRRREKSCSRKGAKAQRCRLEPKALLSIRPFVSRNDEIERGFAPKRYLFAPLRLCAFA
jgi:hypothetical protein